MPPKPKFSREKIIEVAYELTVENGIDSVVARTIGKKLNSSSTPIFTFFDSMDELKKEVYNKAKKEFMDYVRDSVDCKPAFKEFGLRLTKYSYNYPKLYKLLFVDGKNYADIPNNHMQEFFDITNPMKNNLMEAFDLTEQDAIELINHMNIYIIGISGINISKGEGYNEKVIGRLLSEACIGFVSMIRMKKKHSIAPI